MVKNNIEVDVKVKCIEQGKTQVQLAEEIDTTKHIMRKLRTGLEPLWQNLLNIQAMMKWMLRV